MLAGSICKCPMLVATDLGLVVHRDLSKYFGGCTFYYHFDLVGRLLDGFLYLAYKLEVLADRYCFL